MLIKLRILEECYDNKIDIDNLDNILMYHSYKATKGARKCKLITIPDLKYNELKSLLDTKNININKYLKYLYEKDTQIEESKEVIPKEYHNNEIELNDITDNEEFLLNKNFKKIMITKTHYYLINQSDNVNILWFKQNSFSSITL
jgi:hypothetical protein